MDFWKEQRVKGVYSGVIVEPINDIKDCYLHMTEHVFMYTIIFI